MTNFLNYFKKIKFPKTFTVKINLVGFIIALIIVLGGILFFSFNHYIKRPVKAAAGPSTPEEITNIKNTSDLPTQIQWYKKLIERVGPVAAQDDLLNSGLPFTGQTHLLNHEVGDWLYQHDGVSGLALCKEYFLASCYHGFVLDAIATGGMPEVTKVMDACKPQGPTVYPQCAHAVGHGFLAFAGYKNLTQALTMCDQMVTSVPDFPTFNCYDGVFMENIWALHDGGDPSPDRWVKASDPVYPCDDKRIAQKYLLGCWSNQPSLMYQQFQGNIPQVAAECAKVTPADLMQMCYNGLSRQIHPMAAGSLEQTFNMCGLLGSVQWTDYCLVINDQASFSVGDRTLPFQICGKVDTATKDQCYSGLVGMIGMYAKSSSDLGQWCGQITDPTWSDRCKSQQQVR